MMSRESKILRSLKRQPEEKTPIATDIFLPNYSVLPVGIIAVWSGSVASIPQGWALCDGTNGTPNLTDRFVIGAGNTYSPDDTGGAASHTHEAGTLVTGTPSAAISGQTGAAVQVAAPNHIHIVTGETASASSLPPYYALAYIMKL